MVLRAITLAAVFLSAAASAQTTSYQSSNAALMKGDNDKIVCKKQEKIGTRLGAKKVCLTVAEWNEMAREHQERTQQIQMSTCIEGIEGRECLDPAG